MLSQTSYGGMASYIYFHRPDVIRPPRPPNCHSGHLTATREDHPRVHCDFPDAKLRGRSPTNTFARIFLNVISDAAELDVSR
jgi:hypothetical protein